MLYFSSRYPQILRKNGSEKEFEKWDQFSISRSAAQAVRNRKDYFKKA